VSSGGNRYAPHIVDLSSLTLCRVRPCVAGGFIDLAALRSCIDVSGLALERIVAPGHHGYQRACVLITGQASSGAHLCAGKTDPPSRCILLQTSTGKRGLCHLLSPDQCSSSVRAIRPFLRPGLRVFQGIARRGRHGWASRSALHHVCVSPGLDGREHGATLTQVGMKAQLSS
jgi:hypothetical protein